MQSRNVENLDPRCRVVVQKLELIERVLGDRGILSLAEPDTALETFGRPYGCKMVECEKTFLSLHWGADLEGKAGEDVDIGPDVYFILRFHVSEANNTLEIHFGFDAGGESDYWNANSQLYSEEPKESLASIGWRDVAGSIDEEEALRRIGLLVTYFKKQQAKAS